MAKKKDDRPREEEAETTQFSLRLPNELHERLLTTALKLGTNRTNLLRMILAEKLHEWELKARRAQGECDDTPLAT